MTHHPLTTLANRIKSIADIGLIYAKDGYDHERYSELMEISAALHRHLATNSEEIIKAAYTPVAEYPTAKVDIRAFVLSADGKILLVREQSDGCWSLPGGWADIGYSPREVLVKECKEETGLEVVPERMLAVFDKKKHPHPPQAYSVYKLCFLCRAVAGQLLKGHDVLDVGYFDISALPPLSQERILPAQVKILYDQWRQSSADVYFD